MNNIEPFWEEKNWGRVMHVFASDEVATSCLKVESGQCCSRHYHAQRANMFAVVDGVIAIEEWQYSWKIRGGEESTEWKLIKLLRLSKGMSHTVPSGVWHRFRVIESGTIVETYWCDMKGGHLSHEDIVRDTIGGPDPVEGIIREFANFYGYDRGRI